MSSSYTIDKARLVGLFLECIFFGIFTITFPLCIRALVWFDGRLKPLSTIHWPMLVIAILLAAFAIFDVAISLLFNIEAFVLFQGPGGAIEAFTDISNWVNVMKTVDMIIPVLIGDAVLIYRCWVVYTKSYWVILGPCIIWAGGASMAGYMIFLEATLREHGSLQVTQLKPVITSFAILTVVQNIITTSMIIIRIWLVDRESARILNAPTATRRSTVSKGPGGTLELVRKKTRLQNVMRIVIESGLLYTTVAIITFCTYITDSNAFNTVTDAETQIIAIAFNLIIIRAKNQTAEEYTYRYTHATVPLAFGASQGSSSLQSGMEFGVQSGYDDRGVESRYTANEYVLPPVVVTNAEREGQREKEKEKAESIHAI